MNVADKIPIFSPLLQTAHNICYVSHKSYLYCDLQEISSREYKLFAYQGPAIVAGPCFIPGSSALTPATQECDRGGCVLVVEGRGGAAGVDRRTRRLSRLQPDTHGDLAWLGPGPTIVDCVLRIRVPGRGIMQESTLRRSQHVARFG